MATRQEIAQRKMVLKSELRETQRNVGLHSGELLPPVRELAERYQLSMGVVRQELQKLEDEGVLYTVPRVGTYVGRPLTPSLEYYMLLLPLSLVPGDYRNQLQNGFEEQIAQRGGASLTMEMDAALEYRRQGNLPTLAGLFDFGYRPHLEKSWGLDHSIPRVSFASWNEDTQHSDVVSFDDIDGGRQATQHLLRLGHRGIAYLALHSRQAGENVLQWSLAREQGWKQALEEIGWSSAGLAFHPRGSQNQIIENQVQAGCEAARELVGRPDITAVVAANDHAARGLLQALQESAVPAGRWPAMVGFDNLPSLNGHVLTSLRLPWEALGRAAADLLWERRQGLLTGPPVHREVALRLIPRLTCQANWSTNAARYALVAPPQLASTPT